MWCVGELDDEYIEKMEDVLSVYERPYSAAHPVVCLDESPFHCTPTFDLARPMVPGHSVRRDNEYKRNGTANIFAVVEPKAGRHFTRATPDRSGLPVRAPGPGHRYRLSSARTIHLVMDNLNIHRKKSLTDHLGPAQADYLWSRPQGALHTQTREAAPGRNRTQPDLPPMPRQTPHPHSNGYSLRPEHGRKRPITSVCVSPVELHAKKRAPEVRLSKECFYAVRPSRVKLRSRHGPIRTRVE